MNFNRIVSAGILVSCIGAFGYKFIKDSDRKLEIVQDFVLEHNLDRGAKIMYDSPSNLSVWQQAASEIQDSLRIDSTAKTNYAKGAQMVRDSIAKANLNDTVKTVMKSVK